MKGKRSGHPGLQSLTLLYIYIYIYIYIYSKIRKPTKRFKFFEIIFLFLHKCYIYVCFQLVAFVREHMQHKAFLMGYSTRLELTLVSIINDLWLVKMVYIGVVVPLSWSVFTLVYFTRLWVSSSLIEYPIKKALCHICSLMKATSWIHTHVYKKYVRTK